MPVPAPAPIASTSPPTHLWRTARYAAWYLAGALALAGCGASNPPTGGSRTGSGGSSASTQTPRNGGATGGSGGFGAGRGGLGASGLIAAVDGRTVQVQTRTQQTAVVYTSSTRITRLVTTTAAALKVGECVTALPARSTGSTPGAPPTTSPAPTAPPSGPVEAATVQLRAARDGSCGFDGRPGGGGRPGAGTTRPTGTRGAGPTVGVPGRGGLGGAGFGAFGTIASVGQGSFSVTETARSGAGASTTPRTVTVTDGQDTVFLLESPATASAIKVGECARATGRPDDTGQVTATTLALSPATDGSCTGGFGAGRA